jgi:hypothetical protein
VATAVALRASPYGDNYRAWLERVEDLSAVIVALVANGCYWGDETHALVWQRAVQRLGTWPIAGGFTAWLHARRYPAVLTLYGGGVGAVAAGRLSTVAGLLRLPLAVDGRTQTAASALAVGHVLEHEQMQAIRQAATGQRNTQFRTPASDHVFEWIRPLVGDLVPGDELYADCFARFEYYLSLVAADVSNAATWVPGRFAWDRDQLSGKTAAERVAEDIRALGDQSGVVTSGILPSADRAQELLLTLTQRLAGLAW